MLLLDSLLEELLPRKFMRRVSKGYIVDGSVFAEQVQCWDTTLYDSMIRANWFSCFEEVTNREQFTKHFGEKGLRLNLV